VPELQEQIGKFKPGDNVNIIIRRDGETKLIDVTLRNQSGNTSIVDKRKMEAEATILGATLMDIDKNELESLNIPSGVKVESVKKGKMEEAGLKKGFIITHIDKQPIESKKQLIRILNNKKGGVLIEGKYPNGIRGYFGFGL